VYASLLAIVFVGFRYRTRARAWLDGHFFREEYDARKILVSLASRVRFETDPVDLAGLVVRQVDEALHPERTAFIVDGIEPGRLAQVAALHGDIEPLATGSGLVSMLQWSDHPLEVFLQDPRSPLLRLPAADQAWLQASGAALLVPVRGEGLLGVIVLGAKRSEDAYTDEDRQLLASIATQVALGFDVARLRRRADSSAGGDTTRILTPASRPMMECPRCGR
jgi:GAF domain-containing protein